MSIVVSIGLELLSTIPSKYNSITTISLSHTRNFSYEQTMENHQKLQKHPKQHQEDNSEPEDYHPAYDNYSKQEERLTQTSKAFPNPVFKCTHLMLFIILLKISNSFLAAGFFLFVLCWWTNLIKICERIWLFCFCKWVTIDTKSKQKWDYISGFAQILMTPGGLSIFYRG